MRRIATLAIAIFCTISLAARGVTIHATGRDALEALRDVATQAGKNYVMEAGLLDGLTVTAEADSKPLKKVLGLMFGSSDIDYKVKGNDIILFRRRKSVKTVQKPVKAMIEREATLPEVTIMSRLEKDEVEHPEIGARKVTADQIKKSPSFLGEPDVIRAMQSLPGVSAGTDGLAGMHVHGGESDENLYMLDNVPIYQVNHFGGLFSAFNTEAIRYADFFTSSIPARYDGRLSSVMDVRTRSGIPEGHHGSGRLGLTSGAFNIDGPIGDATSYSAAIRRSWFDVLTMPFLTIVNSSQSEEKTHFRYAFMDVNAKVAHRFSPRATASVSAYFGDDVLHTGSDDWFEGSYSEHDRYKFHWGNLMVRAGLNYRFSDNLHGEFTAAFTRFFTYSRIREELEEYHNGADTTRTLTRNRTDNDITDWIMRADFTRKTERKTLRFGAGYTRHGYMPGRSRMSHTTDGVMSQRRDSVSGYAANEIDAYVEYDFTIGRHITANAGFHGTIYNIEERTYGGYAPRLSVGWHPDGQWAVKAAYSRTNQYVHMLTESYLSLPADRWIPTLRGFRPQSADKIAGGVYWQSSDRRLAISAEGYYKRMHNLVDYRDEYYLIPPVGGLESQLTSGSGSAKGIDFKIELNTGRFSGYAGYSLGWSDRTFAEKNGGKTYPARFDNRHTINITGNYQISDRVSISALWTGHSGCRFTLMPQQWEGPDFGYMYFNDEVPLRVPLNNYRLPFYHRLDLSLKVNNSRGYWTFGLYNAYCHMNVTGIRRAWHDKLVMSPEGYYQMTSAPVFQKVKLLPIIPSIAYTWIF